MKEQVQVPFDTRGDTTDQDKANAPKGLDRPVISKNLQAPKVPQQSWFRRRCCCGNWDCNSPVDGRDGPEWFWEYFDQRGQMVFDKDLPLRGGPGNSPDGGTMEGRPFGPDFRDPHGNEVFERTIREYGREDWMYDPAAVARVKRSMET